MTSKTPDSSAPPQSNPDKSSDRRDRSVPVKAQKSSLSHSPLRPTRLAAVSLLSTVLAFGCGNDGSSGTTVVPPPTNGGGGMNDGGTSTEWYVLTSVVLTPDSDNGFVLRTQRLDGQRLEIGDTLEVPGGAAVYGSGDATIFVGQGDAPILTRYEVGSDGSLTETGRMSFANEGFSGMWLFQEQVQFGSSTRAYVLEQDRVVAWNPRDMTIEESFQIPGLEREGYTVSYYNDYLRRQEELVWAISWLDDANNRVLDETALAVMDLATGEVSVSPSVRGCGDMSSGAVAESGEMVFVTSSFGASVYVASDGERGPAPCLLRVAPGATSFSGEVERPDALISGVTGVVAEIMPARPGSALIRAFDTDALEITPETTWIDVRSANAWSWHWLDLDTGSTAPVPELGVNPPVGLHYQLGDRAVVARFPEDFSETELIEITRVGSVPPATVLTTPGVVYSALRARLESEPSARMAQRIEPRGGLSLLPSQGFGN